MSAIERLRALARPSRIMVSSVTMLGVASVALAADTGRSDDVVRERLKTRLPRTQVTSIDCAKVGGLCEVTAGANLFYVDSGARFLVIGRVYDMETRQDITAARLLEMNPDMLVGGAAKANASAAAGGDPEEANLIREEAGSKRPVAMPVKLSLAGLPADGAIVWGNKGSSQEVTIFTDFRCGYCRALKAVLASMDVRVIERPISILGSRDIADRVYCSKNREQALHAAYAGERIEAGASCDTRGLDANEAFAHKNGLGGTPVIVRSDGAVLEGYRPKAFLEQWLREGKS